MYGKGLFELFDCFLGSESLPYLSESSLAFFCYFSLQLVNLTKDEYEIRFNELVPPVFEKVVDEFPRENGVLDLSQAVP